MKSHFVCYITLLILVISVTLSPNTLLCAEASDTESVVEGLCMVEATAVPGISIKLDDTPKIATVQRPYYISNLQIMSETPIKQLAFNIMYCIFRE